MSSELDQVALDQMTDEDELSQAVLAYLKMRLQQFEEEGKSEEEVAAFLADFGYHAIAPD